MADKPPKLRAIVLIRMCDGGCGTTSTRTYSSAYISVGNLELDRVICLGPYKSVSVAIEVAEYFVVPGRSVSVHELIENHG